MKSDYVIMYGAMNRHIKFLKAFVFVYLIDFGFLGFLRADLNAMYRYEGL